MQLTLISPRLAIQKGDFLGSGVPYWPVELATLAAFARQGGDQITLYDLFGTNPKQLEDVGDYYLQGVPVEHFITSRTTAPDVFILYAISYMSHHELLGIVSHLKKHFPATPVAILENSQAVTAYSLQRMAPDFFEKGTNLLICGEPYFNWDAIKECLLGRAEPPVNVLTPTVTRAPERITTKGLHYPVPAWDLFNLEGYWQIPYSHGPKTRRFLPILTSRGCPYPCDFCVVPETNTRRWRGNAPEDVVAEIIELRDRFHVFDFQIEDLNPTVQHDRWRRVCELLIERKAGIRFAFVSGTKAETLHIDEIPILAAAGCRYASISPESGSANLMKVIGKKFNYQHGVDLVAACRKHGIRTQACFLVGHPDETEEDFLASKDYMGRMVDAGLDEVAVFVVAPFAGSSLFAKKSIEVDNQSVLTSFSPKGRSNYETLERRRRELIRVFFTRKLARGADLWLQGLRAMFGTPQTKMENLPKRILFIYGLVVRHLMSARLKKWSS